MKTITCDGIPADTTTRLVLEAHGDVPSGEPIRRPPLIRAEDGWLKRAGKVVLYVVLSPLIAIYIVVDNTPAAFAAAMDMIGRALAVLCDGMMSGIEALARGLGAGARLVGNAISALEHVVGRYLIVPLYEGAVFLFSKAWDAAGWTAGKLLTFVVAPAAKVIAATGRALVTVISHVGRVLSHAASAAARGLSHVAQALASNVLVPILKAAQTIGGALHKFLLNPLWRGICAVSDGALFVTLQILRGVGVVLDVTAQGIVNVISVTAKGIGWSLYYVFTGTTWVVNGVWGTICDIGTATYAKLLVPLYHAALAAGQVIGRFVLAPLYYGAKAVFRGASWVINGVWSGACVCVDGVWHVASFVGRTLHNRLFVPLQHGMTALLGAIGKAVAYAAGGVYILLLAPAGTLIRTVAIALRDAGKSAALAAGRVIAGLARVVHANVLKPVGQALAAAATAATSVIKSAAGVVATAATAMYKSFRAAAKAISNGAQAATSAIAAGARATSKNAKAAARSFSAFVMGLAGVEPVVVPPSGTSPRQTPSSSSTTAFPAASLKPLSAATTAARAA